MRRRKGKQRDHFQRYLREEAVRYKSSQQSVRPRRGVWWFSVDTMGNIALFDSREAGNVPLAVFTNSLEEHLTLFENFVRPSVEHMAGDPEVDAPKQGLYFYDLVDFYKRPFLLGATLNIDGYDRLGVPESPLNLSECPEHIRALLAKVQFDGAFRDTSRMFVAKHWKCI